MGMSIDEQIRGLEYLKKCGIFPFSDTRTGIIFTDECVDEAINTMRKNQKIEQILRDDFEEYHSLDRDSYKLYLIKEVLEEGNDD